MSKKFYFVGSDVIDRLIQRYFCDNSKNDLYENPISDKSINCNCDVGSDYFLILDLYCISYSLVVEGESFYTNKKKYKKQNVREVRVEDIEKTVIKERIICFSERILCYFENRNIILIKSGRGKYKANDSQITIDEKNNDVINQIIAWVEELFCKKTDCNVIDIRDYFFLKNDSNSKNPYLDYIEDYYDALYEEINKIVENIFPKSIIVKRPKYKYILNNFIKYGEHLLKTGHTKIILDSDDLIDGIVIGMGRELVERYYSEILMLSDEMTIENGIPIYPGISDDFYQVVALIIAVKNGDLLSENVDYSLAFRSNGKIRDWLISELSKQMKKVDIIGTISVNPNNVSTCYAIYCCFMKNDYAKAINLALSETKILKEPVKIDIWGACISREIYNLCCDGSLMLEHYIYRCCCLHAFDGEVSIDVGDNDDSFFGSAWRKRVMLTELKRLGPGVLSESDAQWIIIDLYDIIEKCYSFNDQNFILDLFSQNSLFFKKNQSKFKEVFYYKMPWEDIKKRLDMFADFLYMKYGNNIILIRTYLSSVYLAQDDSIIGFDDNETYETTLRNVFLRKCEDYLINRTNCYSIGFSNEFLGDSHAIWGQSRVHYENSFNIEALKCINMIINTSPTYRHFNKYDYKTRIERIVRLKKGGATHKDIWPFFNSEILDRIVISLSANVIESNSAYLESLYYKNYDKLSSILFDINMSSKVDLIREVKSIMVSSYE